MAYLIDTSIIARLANSADSQYTVALRAVTELHHRGKILHLTPQVLIEFRNVATRPIAQNGLGLSAAEAEAQASGFEFAFPLLPDTPAIYPAWRAVVNGLAIIGKRVHDARLLAVCHAHGIDHLLTFNIPHFTQMAKFGPNVDIVDPVTI